MILIRYHNDKMNNERREIEWQELKEIWINSAQTRQINIQMTGLLDELKSKLSQFEKDAINRDLIYIARLLKRFLNLFKSDKY